MGIEVAAMTYDKREAGRKFTQRAGIEFPILQDVNQVHVKRFGILNRDYAPGHRVYGIPHPGMLLLDNKGVVRFKLAEEGYRKRPPWPEVLQAARKLAGADS